MLQSMTGFGSASVENDKMVVTAEIKSLNSKFSDIYCRIPRQFSDKEIEIRNLLSKELERGKIEFTLTVAPKEGAFVGTTVNRPTVKAYFRDLQETAKELGFQPSETELLRMATMMPNAYNTGNANEEDTKADWQFITDVVLAALHKCKEFRLQEGLNTKEKFMEYIAIIGELLEQVAEQDPKRIPIIRERIEKAVSEWAQNENFDTNRFEQELIYYVEKFDISEEKVRLKNHLDYFLKELHTASNGKKLNFIAQEIGREINTIGSKANDAVIQRLVVQMKDELEKIKEQTLNIV
ncbi:MAG: YicC/YloC family endoribonuclease [Spirosomataceae bacterium]